MERDSTMKTANKPYSARWSRRLPAAALCVALALPASWAHAQELGGAEGGLSDIVVTARKREESLQTVPVAVSALAGEALQRTYAVELKDLDGFAPNVTIGTHSSWPSSAQITIRGLTSMDIERTFEPSVGVAVDGVFLPTNTNQMLDMFDIERIEILRGPQGTLFGKNTIGGVVSARRKRPSLDGLSLEAELNAGNYGRRDVKVAVDAALVQDKLGIRVSMFSKNFDGIFKNTYDDSRRGGQDLTAIRSALSWKITDDASLLINWDHMREDSDSGAVLNVSNPNDSYGLAYCSLGRLPCGIPDDLYTISQDARNKNKVNRDSLSSELTVNVGGVDLTSISAYSRQYEDLSHDFDGESIQPPFFHTSQRIQREKYFSQELRANAKVGETINLVAGLFYFDHRYKLRQFDDIGGLRNFTQRTRYRSKSFAAFAQADWEFMPQWRLTLGGRYTKDRKFLDYHMPRSLIAALPETLVEGVHYVEGLKKSFDEFTYKAGLDFKPSDDALVYASISTGFKGGGFNGRAGTLQSALEPYDPETVTSYELGGKLDFLDRRLRINAAIFYADYKDLQADINLAIVDPLTGGSSQQTIVRNAAQARAKGLELEVTALPVDDLMLRGSLGLLDTGYKSFTANLTGRPDDVRDYSDRRFRRAPKYQFSVGADYTVHLPADKRLVAHLDYSWTSSQDMTLDNDPWLRQRSVGSLDGSLTLHGADDRWRVALYGRNLTNERYIGYGFRAGDLWQFGSPSEPRTYGVVLGVRLN